MTDPFFTTFDGGWLISSLLTVSVYVLCKMVVMTVLLTGVCVRAQSRQQGNLIWQQARGNQLLLADLPAFT